jgi:hypothetical protein
MGKALVVGKDQRSGIVRLPPGSKSNIIRLAAGL